MADNKTIREQKVDLELKLMEMINEFEKKHDVNVDVIPIYNPSLVKGCRDSLHSIRLDVIV